MRTDAHQLHCYFHHCITRNKVTSVEIDLGITFIGLKAPWFSKLTLGLPEVLFAGTARAEHHGWAPLQPLKTLALMEVPKSRFLSFMTPSHSIQLLASFLSYLNFSSCLSLQCSWHKRNPNNNLSLKLGCRCYRLHTSFIHPQVTLLCPIAVTWPWLIV